MKKFNELLEEHYKLATNLVSPGSIAHLKKFAKQVRMAQQPDIDLFLQRVEEELNKHGLTLGEIDYTEPFEDTGSEDFALFNFATKETIENAFLSIDWETVSPDTRDERPGVLTKIVKMEVVEVSTEEFEAVFMEESAELEEAVDPTFKRTLKDMSDSQLKQKLKYYREKDQDKYNAIVTEFEMRGLKEETNLEEAVITKSVGKKITFKNHEGIVLTCNVTPSMTSLAIGGWTIEFKPNDAKKVMEQLMEFFMENTN